MLVNLLFDVVLLLFASLLSAAASIFLNFALGKPAASAFSMNEDEQTINPHAIFFTYTFYLATRRLQKHFTKEALESLRDSYNVTKSKDAYASQLATLQCKREMVTKGREFFTVEHALGMCIYCTNFWLSLAIALLFYYFCTLLILPSFFIFLTIPVIAHLFISKF